VPEDSKITMTERDVRIVAREVAQEVVSALLTQTGLTMEHLIYLKSHAESMKTQSSGIKSYVTTKVLDFGFLLMVGGLIWYVKG
jgi:hypothetical protein